jgi:uroporphyrinogen-III synthase
MAKKALKGKLVVVTRSVEGSEPWIKYLKEQGATPYFFPTIEIVPADITPTIENALKNISDFDWVIFTSAAGVRSMKLLAEKSGINLSPKRMPKIAAIGIATAAAAKRIGYRVAFKPSESKGVALGYELEPVNGKSILLLRTAIASHDILKILKVRGGKITDLSLYKTIYRRDPDLKFGKLLESGKIDFLTFASPSAVRGFFQRVPKNLIPKSKEIPSIAIGEKVLEALKKAGFKNIKIAKEPTVEEMVACLKKS